MRPVLVDSHCHLHMLNEQPGHPSPYLQRAREQGIGHFLTVSIDLDTFPDLLRIAETHPEVSTTVGIHPCGAHLRETSAEEMAALADHPKVLAIGETGLDYQCIGDDDREWQHARFREQVRAARLAGKPVVIHSRGAPDDTVRILREEGADRVGGIIHCFTEDMDMAAACLELGFYISLSGIVTFPRAKALRKVAAQLPADRLLLETDCPYLAPVPHRGRQNQPAWVRQVAECVAEVRGVPVTELAATTTENFYTLFPQAPAPVDSARVA